MPRRNYADGERQRIAAQMRKLAERLEELEQDLHDLWLRRFEEDEDSDCDEQADDENDDDQHGEEE